MFGDQLTDPMRRLINQFKRDRQRKRVAAARGRAIDCMELEDRILLSASPIAPQAIVKETPPDAQQTTPQTAKAVAADANGNHVVVWTSQDELGHAVVNAQRFNAAGVAQGDLIQANTRTGHVETEAKVAMRSDGSFAITWTESNGTSGSADVYMRSFDANGNALQPHEILVNDNNVVGDQMNPSVTINNNGISVLWTSQDQANGKWDLFVKSYDVEGNPIGFEGSPAGTALQVNATSSSAPIQSQAEMDGGGYVMVVWQGEDAAGNQDVYGRYGSFCNNDTWDSGPYVVNTTLAGNQYNPSIGFNPVDWSFVVSWTNDGQDGSEGGIYAATV